MRLKVSKGFSNFLKDELQEHSPDLLYCRKLQDDIPGQETESLASHSQLVDPKIHNYSTNLYVLFTDVACDIDSIKERLNPAH